MSGIQHYCFCKRQWALIHIEQAWADDPRTVAGNKFHKNVDNPFFHEKRGNTITVRSVPVSSVQLGLSGICDLVEFIRDEKGVCLNQDKKEELYLVRPVEYKVGHRKNGKWDMVQLCAETIALEEFFDTHIETAFLYYGSEKHRFEIHIDNDLRSFTDLLASEMHELFNEGKTPKAIQTDGCKRCSLKDICMPELSSVSNIKAYISEMKGEE